MGDVCALLRPFAGYLPSPDYGHRVAGPPAATLSAEQIEKAQRDPLSFRYTLGRSACSSHARAVEWINAQNSRGVLQPVEQTVLVYRQSGNGFTATGLIADVSLDAYAAGRVERHEKTIEKTERKMADYMHATRVYGNPVALGHRPNTHVTEVLDAHAGRVPDTAFTSIDGMTHELWPVTGDDSEALCREFDSVLYVTDGHHRLAAAARVAAEEGRVGAFLPAGLFSSEELRLRAFARCLIDLKTDSNRIIEELGTEHHLVEVDAAAARPTRSGEFGVGIGDRYFRLRLGHDEIPNDPYESLDVNLLQNLILEPLFGIPDPRGDKHLRFVADLSETSHLDLDAPVWFLPYPAAVEEVMAVADSGRVMPPKSTLFTPKLPAGLVVRLIDEG